MVLDNGIFWITGLPSSGKTTLGFALHKHLAKKGIQSVVVDGDRLRAGLCKDLGFSPDDRLENIRRAAELAKLLAESGLWVICCLVSPMESMRRAARSIVSPYNFYEVYLDCPVDTCAKRDVKGLYQQARSGKVNNLTGIDAPYESPAHPNFTIYTGKQSLEHSVKAFCQWADTVLGEAKV